MFLDTQFHPLQLYSISACTNRPILVNVRPGEKPDNYRGNDGLYLVYYFGLGGLRLTGSSFGFVLVLFSITTYVHTFGKEGRYICWLGCWMVLYLSLIHI